MAYNVRCTWRRGCGKAMTLRKHPGEYQRYPRCPHCKRGHLNVIHYAKLQTQTRTCRCGHIRWPHKRGLFLSENEFCVHADVELFDDGPARVTRLRPDEPCPF